MHANTFEMKVGKAFFVVEAKNLENGRESAEEKLKNIMIKDLIAKDNVMASQTFAETVDFQDIGTSNESLKKISKMA